MTSPSVVGFGPGSVISPSMVYAAGAAGTIASPAFGAYGYYASREPLYICLSPGCEKHEYRLPDDLDEHYQRDHRRDTAAFYCDHNRDVAMFYCDYPDCRRSRDPIRREGGNLVLQHLMRNHQEQPRHPSGKVKVEGEELAVGGWWRCERCFRRVFADREGSGCPDCTKGETDGEAGSGTGASARPGAPAIHFPAVPAAPAAPVAPHKKRKTK